MRAVVVGLACALLGVACVESSSAKCGPLTCPSTFVCTSDQRCVSREALAACESKPNGDPCSADGLSGECLDDACVSIVCGNNRLDPREVCDDGNLVFGDTCNPTCNSDLTCGNGFVDPGEGCDCGDGQPGHASEQCAMANSDDAAASCRTNCTPHACGDGVIEKAEQCEDAVATTVTCQMLGYYVGSTVGCDDVCQFDVSQCSERCGDTMLNGPELCEGTAPPAGESCINYGYDAGPLACAPSVCRPSFTDCRDIGWIEYALDSRGFYAVSGTSATNVWGAGNAGGVLHWDGTTWLDKPILGATGAITGIWAGSSSVYAVSDAAIYRRDSSAWTTALEAAGLLAISGSGSHVIAVGNAGQIRVWDGAEWTTPTTVTDVNLDSVHVVSSTLAYAGGTDTQLRRAVAELVKWNGSSWSQVAIPPMAAIRAVWARAENDLYIGGSALLHWNGTTWSTIALGIDAEVAAVHGTATDVYVAYSDNGGTVAHFDGTAWNMHDTGLTGLVYGVWANSSDQVFTAATRMARYAGSGWVLPRPEQAVAFTAVTAAAGGDVLAVGDRGLALAHDGVFWRRVPSAIVSPRGAHRNFVVGDHGTLGTFDGVRIVARSSNTTADLSAVWAVSDTQAWAVGSDGTIVHYNDGVSTVTTLPAPINLRAVFGFAANDVYVGGDLGTLLHWDGVSWSPAAGWSATNTVSVTGIWGLAPDNMFVVGTEALVRHLDDSGWNTIAAPAGSAFTSITGTADRLFLSTQGEVLSWTANTGMRIERSAIDQRVGGDLTRVYMTGPNLALRSYSSSGWTLELPTFASETTAYLSMYIAAPNAIYAATTDSGAYLVRFDGLLWTRVALDDVAGVDGTAPNNVWVISRNGNTYRYDGSTWAGASGGDASMFRIAVGATDSAWAAGVGAPARYAAGQWSTLESSPILTDVSAVDATTAFGVGSGGSIMRWTGTTFEVVTGSPSFTVQAVWATSSTHVYGAGLNAIARYNAGNWTVTQLPGRAFLDIDGSAANDVFAVGVAGDVLHFNGDKWSPVNSRVIGNIESVSVTPKLTVFGTGAAGSPGTILTLRRDVAW